uniref:Kunitz trypsin inhibitor n=1 Tax=Lotus japonicus TaxID=34305 RepID=I3S844_LOTJA|nr:unknown [Lotus japonicus]
MKPIPLSLCFLFFAFISTKLPTAFSPNDVEQVLDVNGDSIFPGGRYYIRPAIRGPPGGGVRLGKTGDSDCPVTALQEYSEVKNGIPVRFRIAAEVSTGIIFTGTELDIEFTVKPHCVESPKWIVFVDNEIGKACVGIGGAKDHPGKQTFSGTFNIQKNSAGFGYKLVFCIKGSPTCLDIGRYDNGEGGKRLNLTEHEAFDLVFVPVGVADSAGIRSVV